MVKYIRRNSATLLIGLAIMAALALAMALFVYQGRRVELRTERRIEAVTAFADICTHHIAAVPITINDPGRYCLSGNVSSVGFAGDAITVQSSHVTLDGRGFTITGSSSPDTESRGILSVDQHSLTVTDINFQGFNTAVLVADTTALIAGTTFYPAERKSRDILVENVRSDDATFHGIHVRADNFTISNNTIAGVGPSTVVPDAFATGIYTDGNGCEISSNRIMLGAATGTGENIGIGSYYAAGCRIERNTILFDRLPEFGRNFGIWTKPSGGSLPYVSDNYVSGAHHAYGPHGMFKSNVAANSLCSLFAVRPDPIASLHDLGGNIERDSSQQPRPGATVCYSNPDNARARFNDEPTENSAYGVALAIAETDPIAREMESRAWLFLAACLGHPKATEDIALIPADAMTREARAAAQEIRQKHGIACDG